VAGLLKIAFLNIEGFSSKLGSSDFLNLPRAHDIRVLGIAECGAG
jgi:hypothetical protein